MQVSVLCWLALVSEYTAGWVETILNVLDTNSTHTNIAYAHLTCTLYLWLPGLCTPCRARCEKQHKNHWWLFVLKYASFHSTRSGIIAHILTWPSVPLNLTLEFHGQDISCIIHSYNSLIHYSKTTITPDVINTVLYFKSFGDWLTLCSYLVGNKKSRDQTLPHLCGLT